MNLYDYDASKLTTRLLINFDFDRVCQSPLCMMDSHYYRDEATRLIARFVKDLHQFKSWHVTSLNFDIWIANGFVNLSTYFEVNGERV